MYYSIELMQRVFRGDPEAEGRRAARVDDLEEDVCRGDYRVASQEIVSALISDSALARLCPTGLTLDVR